MREMVLMGKDALAALQQVARRSLQQAESNAPWHGTCVRKISAEVLPSLCFLSPH